MIEVKKGIFGYGNSSIVAGPLDITVEQSETVAMVGTSGCGKSTILKAISGEIQMAGGQLRLDGKVRDRNWRTEHLARTLQSFPLLHWLTVEENLQLAAKYRKISKINIGTVLEEFTALHLRQRYPRTLSGGERCRASLAQAALTKPKVLLLDEPFNGLDLQVKEDIATKLFNFAKTHRTSIMFVTHDLYDACEYASRVIVLQRHREEPTTVSAIVKPGQPDAVKQIRKAMLKSEANNHEQIA